MKHKKSKKTLYLLLLLLVIASIFTIFKYNKLATPKTIESKHFLYVDVVTHKNLTESEVYGYLGDDSLKYIIIPKGSLYFYSLSPGLNMTREINLTNIYNVPVELQAQIAGNITPITTYQLPTTLGPKESQKLTIQVSIPQEIAAGTYRGNLTITLTPQNN